MPNPKKKYTIEEARAFAKKNPEAFNKALDKINPDPYRGTRKFAELLINQYPDRFKGLKPENFLSMLDSIAKAESPQGNVIQRSYNKKTKKYYNGPARGYYQIETTSAPTFSNRYKAYQDILKPLSAVPLPDIKVPKSGDVRSLSRDEQARLALANMSTVAAVKKEKLNPFDSQNSWLNFHWNGSPADKPARQQHWKETFGYGGGGAVGGKLKNQVEPTRADSLDLLNNTKSLENYYSKYNKSYSSSQDAPEINVNVHALNKNSADTFFTSGASVKVPRKDGTSMYLKRELFPKDQYYKKVDNNRYYQRELANRILDTRAPMALYDKRIAPNNFTAYLNDIPNDGMYGDGITIYGYDPLSVTPWDMLNSKDKANRISQFGIAGTPYKSMKEYKASKSVSKPTQQFQDTVAVPQVTPEAQTQINTGSSTPVTLGMSSPDSSTGKRLYRYGNKDITEQEFNKYKTLGKHKIVEYGGGGEIYYSDPNKFIEAQQAYNDSTNYYNFMHSERRKIPHGADPKAWMNSKEANDLLIEESNLQGAVMDRNTRAGVKLGKLPYPTLPVSKPVFRPTHANGGVIDTNTYGKQDVNRSLMQSGGRIKAKDGLIVNPGFDAGVQRKDNTQVIIPNQVQQNQEVFNARQDQQQTYLKPDTNIYSDKQKTEQRNYNKFDERRDAVGNTIKSLGIDPKLPFTDPKEFALQTALGALPIDKLGKIAKLDKLGKALGTSEGLLSNTYKVNPWAFKPNSNAYYRMIGQEGYKDALESGVIRPPQYHYITPQGMPKLGDHNIELIDGNLKQKLNFPKYEESYYNSQYPLDTRWFPDNFKNRKARISGYKGPYMAEINGNHNLFNSPEGIASYQGPDIKATITTSKKHIPINTPGTKFYKEHWLQGYKEVPKTNIKSTWSIIN